MVQILSRGNAAKRERIIAELGDLAHRRFLVYLMGPYKAFDVASVLESADDPADVVDPTTLPDGIDFGTLVGSDQELDRDGATLDLLPRSATDYGLTPG